LFATKEHAMTLGPWETVRVTLDDGVAWVELNRPEKRNAMNPTLNAEMVEVLETLDAEDGCGVLVLTGAGDSFSAGMDLKEYFREVDGAPEHVQRKVRRDAALWQWRLLRTYPKATIAMVNGWCFGGAFTPLAACDLAIASTAASFATPGVNIGAFCSTPGVALGRAVGRKAAMEMLLTGAPVTAERACATGLVNRVVPPDALDAEVTAMATLIASKSREAIAGGKQLFYRQLDMSLPDAYDVAGKSIACAFFTEDGQEGVDAFLGKRAPRWKAPR